MIRWLAVAFTLGAWWLQQQAHLWPWWLGVAPLGIGAFVGMYTRDSALRSALLIACAAAAGFMWADVRAQLRLADALPAQSEARDITVTGVVQGVPFAVSGIGTAGVRFAFDVEHVDTVDAQVPQHISVSWYGRSVHGQTQSPPVLVPGQRWRLQLRLRRPHGSVNPYGFDIEQWLLEQGFRATASVRPADGINRQLDEFAISAATVIDRARYRVAQHIAAALPDAPYAGVMVALVVGEQRGISADDWTVFNRTGIGHLLSISGLHITMLAALAAALAARLWRLAAARDMRWTLTLSAPQAAALAGFVAALVYTLLAGFAVPAQRTLWMLCVVAFAMFAQRGFRHSHVLGAALALVVVLDPWAVVAPGFWLSFVAVASLMFAGLHERVRPRDLRLHARWSAELGNAARAQTAVTLALAPLTVLFFQQVSVIGPVANAVAIPVVSFIVTPLALAGGLFGPLTGLEWPLVLAHAVFAWLARVLSWLSELPLASLEWPVPTHWATVAALAGLAWMLAPRGIPARSAGVLLLVPLVLTVHPMPLNGTVAATAFDVGQGMAVLIETAHHRLLYDTGPRYTEDADAGNRVLVPYLRAIGASHLDGLVVSHADHDHAGGALSVLGERDVDWLLSPLGPDDPIPRAAKNPIRCTRGLHWVWDGVAFEVLNPGAEVPRNSNASSCVVKVSVGGRALLLTGDIERAQEATLVAELPRAVRADAMLVPHHGSLTSSSTEFIAAVSPRLAIVQAGYLNRFGHPRSEVLERYQAAGVGIVRTDRDGAVLIELSDGGIHWTTWREIEPRYWRATP